MIYDPEVFSIPEGIDPDKFIVATYYIEAETSDILKRAEATAIEQTTGTWVRVPEETDEVRRRHVGRVVSIHEIPPYELELPEVKERKFIVQIAYPAENFGAQLPLLLTTTIGNVAQAGKLKLLDIALPKSFVAEFKGPKFGIDGVRNVLKVPKRPLVLTMGKPCVGATPEIIGKMFYEAALGGLDIYKDDELLGNPSFCPVVDRVAKCMEANDKAYEETGEKTLYCVNITDEINRMLELADKVVEAGGNALMVNTHTVGLTGLRTLAEDPSINLPILVHPAFSGAIFTSPYQGVSLPLIHGKLPRLAGGDLLIYAAPYGKFPMIKERYVRIAQILRAPFYQIKPVFPAPAGGLHPGTVEVVTADIGLDHVFSAGGAVWGHPKGYVAGARALRQAIDAVLQGITVEEAAREYEELRIALETWGVYGKPGLAIYDLKK